MLQSLELEKHKQNLESDLIHLITTTQKDENLKQVPMKELALERFPKKNIPSPEILQQMITPSGSDRSFIAITSDRSDAIHWHKNDTPLPTHYYFNDLVTALKNDPTLLDSYMNPPEKFLTDIFATLICARWQNGTILYVPKNTKIDGVIHSKHLFNENTGTFFYRVLIIAEEGSEFTYLDESKTFVSNQEENPHASGLVEIHAGPNTKIHYAQFQNWSENALCFSRTSIDLAENAQMNASFFQIGGHKGQSRIQVNCNGKSSEVNLSGITLATNNQNNGTWITSRHSARRTSSTIHYNCIAKDQAKCTFNGLITITADGGQSSAHLHNANLLLSDQAIIHAKPTLEIGTDDVQCSHGSSTSSIDENQLYYLQSRGIPKSVATEMIVKGSIESIISKTSSKILQMEIRNLLPWKEVSNAES